MTSKSPRYARKQPEERRRELIDAAIRCLGRGGLSAFTIDTIRREAGVSRGLINHHFDGKDDLLAAAYEAMTVYLAEAPRAALEAAGLTPVERLDALIAASFEAEAFDRSRLHAWLALWGEVSTNSRLQELHRRRYDRYRDSLAGAIAAIAKERGRAVDAAGLARTLIALIDGLWLEWCLDSSVLSPDDARAACYDIVEPQLGPIRP